MPTIATDDLDITFRDTGPPDGEVVLLLHGWPDDASTWDGVAPRLNAVGLRTIVPTLRGFGGTRFRTDGPRTGNAEILAIDAIGLMDALRVERFVVAGHDWGSSTAEALAIGWPDRVRRLAMLSSPPRIGGTNTPSFEQATRYWYHWFMATERGAEAVRADGRGFARIMWELWSPRGWFEDATFERVAASFDSPDWAEVTLHSYRARWGEAKPDPGSLWLAHRVRETKSITTPTLYFQGAVDAVNPPAISEGIASKFTGGFERVLMPGVGHFPTREAPDAVATRLVAHFNPLP